MRTWPSLAAIGAGLVHLGLAAGSPPLLLAVLLLPGVAEVGWGVLALARPERSRPRIALGVAAGIVAVQVVVLVAGGHVHTGGGTHLPEGAIAGAAALDLAVAACLAVSSRRGSGRGEPGPLAFVLGTAVGAGLVAVVTASSLAGTAVGAHHVH